MIKIIVWTVFFSVFLTVSGEAKYSPPPEGSVKTRSDYLADYQLNLYDEDKDGKLSEEEYKKRFENMSRSDRRNFRKAQKSGESISVESRFKAMDANNDGKVSEDEMAEYIKKMRDAADYSY